MEVLKAENRQCFRMPNQLKAQEEVSDYAQLFTVPALTEAHFLISSMGTEQLLHHNRKSLKLNYFYRIVAYYR